MGRAPCCDKANVKRGPWSPEEDSKLKEYMAKHGTGGNWIALPHKAGLKRCGKSCRLRWLNYLRPNIKHGDFTDEEDRIICTLFATIGSRWSIIAAQLPGRTDNDIKNYWNTKLKKKLMAMAAPTQYNSYQRKPSPPPPPPKPSNQTSLLSSSPISPHKTLTSYNYYTSTPTKSFPAFEPTLSQFNLLTNMSSVTAETHLQYNNIYPANLKDNNNNNNHVNMYGGTEPSLCSINGREIKQEEITQMGFQFQHQSSVSNNIVGCEENQKFMLSHGTTSAEGEGQINLNQWAEEAAVVDYELEDFKQLIISSNNWFNIDENKTKQEVMFLYN